MSGPAVLSVLAVLTAPSPAKSPQELLELRLDYRIGAEQDPDWTLGPVGDALLGPDGELFVAQPDLPEIVVFDDTGRPLEPIGGRGQGPGEFMSLLSIGTRGNDLFASDPAQMRVTTFSFDGDLVDSKRWRSEIPPTRSGAFLLLPNSPLVVFADGSALVRPNLVAMATAPAVGQSEDRLRIPLLRTDSMGTVLDTIAWEEPASSSVGIRHRGAVYSIVAPFEATSMTAVGRGGTGVVVASTGVNGQQGSSRATLVRIEPTGDTAFTRAFDYPAVPLTAEHVGRVLAETDVFPGGSDEVPSGLEFEDELRRNGLIPQYLPPFAGLFVGQDGSIWVRREAERAGVVDYTLLDEDGGSQGTVRLPREQQVIAARGSIFATAEESSLGVPVLRRYGIVP